MNRCGSLSEVSDRLINLRPLASAFQGGGKVNIPDEAVEAAARIGEHHAGVFQAGHCVQHTHEDSFECVARLMLEAAAPHLMTGPKDGAFAQDGPQQDANPARIITAYLEEHGDRYDLANSASIRVLALDLQETLTAYLENGTGHYGS